VEVRDSEIVVTLPHTRFAVAYYKLPNDPQLYLAYLTRALPLSLSRRQPLAIFEAPANPVILAGETGFCRLLDTLGGIRGVSASGSAPPVRRAATGTA
jgi:hypothetical protein